MSTEKLAALLRESNGKLDVHGSQFTPREAACLAAWLTERGVSCSPQMPTKLLEAAKSQVELGLAHIPPGLREIYEQGVSGLHFLYDAASPAAPREPPWQCRELDTEVVVQIDGHPRGTMKIPYGTRRIVYVPDRLIGFWSDGLRASPQEGPS